MGAYSGNAGYGTNSPCVGQPISQFHTTGFDDVKGCALAIAYKSNARDVKPEDFAVFSVNHTCVWYLNTAFEVPDLPECPPGGCTCAWFWIHSVSGCLPFGIYIHLTCITLSLIAVLSKVGLFRRIIRKLKTYSFLGNRLHERFQVQGNRRNIEQADWDARCCSQVR